jgi:hypothetical protein
MQPPAHIRIPASLSADTPSEPFQRVAPCIFTFLIIPYGGIFTDLEYTDAGCPAIAQALSEHGRAISPTNRSCKARFLSHEPIFVM